MIEFRWIMVGPERQLQYRLLYRPALAMNKMRTYELQRVDAAQWMDVKLDDSVVVENE